MKSCEMEREAVARTIWSFAARRMWERSNLAISFIINFECDDELIKCLDCHW